MVETALFILVIIMAFGFLFVSFSKGKISGFFSMGSLVLFMILAVWMGSGLEVAATTTTTDGATTWTETKVFLNAGTDAFWLTYLFTGFGALNLILFVKGVWTAD